MKIKKKTFKALAAAAFCAAYCATAIGFNVVDQFTFQLYWQSSLSPGGLTNYVEPTNWCFNIYQTTNIGTQVTNYQLGFVVRNWTLGPVSGGLQWYTSPPVTYPGAQYFFTCVVSNSNGELAPSNVAFNAPWNDRLQGLGIIKR